MLKQLTSKLSAATLTAAIVFAVTPAANAGLLAWDIAGTGATSASQAGSTSSLRYALSGPDVYSTQTWTATAVADQAGDYTFDWNYSGFHAFFAVTAFLDVLPPAGGVATLVDAGPANCCSMPSNGFGYSGNYTFENVNAGDTLRFSFGGRNGDSDARLQGTLVLEQAADVPEPASVALFGLAFAGMLAARRRVR